MMAADGGALQQAKLVLLGDMGAGKSSVVLRFVKGQFYDYQESTIGAAFLTKTLPEQNVKFEIWDTAGQERYHSLAPMYYRGAAAAVVVFDITNEDSFKKAQSWVKELQRMGNPNMIMSLAGNKADLAENRAVQVEDAKVLKNVNQFLVQAYADENGLTYWETSAKSNTNVNDLFVDIATRLPREQNIMPPAQGGIELTEQTPPQARQRGCCS